MRKLLAIALICICTAAAGQSYEDRVAAERAEATLKALDDYQMDKERAKQRAEQVKRDRSAQPTQEEDYPPWVGVLVVVLAAAGWGFAKWQSGRGKP